MFQGHLAVSICLINSAMSVAIFVIPVSCLNMYIFQISYIFRIMVYLILSDILADAVGGFV